MSNERTGPKRTGLWIWDDSPYPVTLRDFSQFIIAPMIARFEQHWLEEDRIFRNNFCSKSKLKFRARQRLRIKLPEYYEVLV